MKKLNVVIIVVMCVVFFNNVYASQKVAMEVLTSKNNVCKNDNIQVKVILKNLDKNICAKNISGYIDYDKSVFETVTNNDIYINNRILKDSYNEVSKKIFTSTNLKLSNNANVLTIKLKVKENVRVNYGYVYIKQLYIIDENYKKIEINNKNIKFTISNTINNDSSNLLNNLSINGITNNMSQQVSRPILENFSKILSIPLEGTCIIVYSFLAVILFRVFVGIVYKGSLNFFQRFRRIGQIRRLNKIFKSIN